MACPSSRHHSHLFGCEHTMFLGGAYTVPRPVHFLVSIHKSHLCRCRHTEEKTPCFHGEADQTLHQEKSPLLRIVSQQGVVQHTFIIIIINKEATSSPYAFLESDVPYEVRPQVQKPGHTHSPRCHQPLEPLSCVALLQECGEYHLE